MFLYKNIQYIRSMRVPHILHIIRVLHTLDIDIIKVPLALHIHMVQVPLMLPMMQVKNGIIPSCVNCVHFIKYNPNKLFLDTKSGKCRIFNKKNILTSKIEYEYSSTCRKDKNKCGKYGKYFISINN